MSIDYWSQQFLGKPYITGAQGEGIVGEFDQTPLYRFDAFDCVTYVNNVLAKTLSSNEVEFEKKLLQINYYNGIPKYENRFHFMSVDWNTENQKNNIIVDITEKISDFCLYAEGEIDRPNWFLCRSENDIKLNTPHNIAERVQKLRRISHRVKKEFARVPYIPLASLFDNNKNPIKARFDKIPHESIVEIVRPNWNLRDKIGTNLHISHVGFVIHRDNQLFFRHASSEAKCVVEVLLVDYLKNCLDSSTIKGINVQINPK